MSNGSESSSDQSKRLRWAALGLEFLSSMFGCIIGGYLIDEYFHATPWFTSVGIIGGMVLAMYRLIVGMRAIDRIGRN
jgi:F0F1-type ATP synthase assembly protein I